ncbi:unnamed protein product [Symbiodinium necroappetens]|uniref:Uncharacterized protein n=1 Tax=Symbiodinium necroappetens TaxID=1628268 RepID=A0A812L6Y8_9DINO|nr:unnamed protein product [Symbiodinium necroappetens]
MSEMAKYPDVNPKIGYEFGKVQRSLDKQIKVAKDANAYDSVTILNSANRKLTTTKDVYKATAAYLPAKGAYNDISFSQDLAKESFDTLQLLCLLRLW